MYFLVKFKMFGVVGFLARGFGQATWLITTTSPKAIASDVMQRQCDLISLHSRNFEFWQFSEIVQVDKSGGFQTHFSMASKIE